MTIAVLVAALAAQQCADYVARGYCQDAKYQSYMSRHCPDACSGGAPAPPEDEACGSWAAEGYCTHPQFVSYMERSCPLACGFTPQAAGAGDPSAQPAGNLESADNTAAAAVEAEAYQQAYEEEEEEEQAPDEEEAPGPGYHAAAAKATATDAAAGEPEHCAGWARQGLCEPGSQHVDYMRQNCAKTCERVPAGGSDSQADPMTCARWAIMGYCAETHTHAAFMQANCREECDKAAQMGEATAPPFDIWVILLLGGFGALVTYAAKAAIARDGKISGDVKRRTLKEEHEVGSGDRMKKANRSALGMQKRSAKKIS